jgi:type IV pilus assembly protein PilC
MQISTDDLLRTGTFVHAKKKSTDINFLRREINISFLSDKNQLKNKFFSEMSVLLSSGMDLVKTLEIIGAGLKKQKEKKIIDFLLLKIVNGNSLSASLLKSSAFSDYDSWSVRIGEESGNLIAVLTELSEYYERKINQTRHIRGALTYPIMVLFTAILSLTFMLNFIVPMFKDVFLRFNGNLPPITKAIISFSESFHTYFMIALSAIVTFSIFCFLNRKKTWYRSLTSSLLLRVPILSPIISLTYKTRYCQTFKLLMTSKVHLQEAIELIRRIINFYPLEIALYDINNALSSGKTLAESMEKHSFFDTRMISMTRVAEEVNKLDLIYNQLYQQYSSELDVRIKTMNNLLEPLLIIFVGGLVALILVSMYLPIFQLGSGLGS